VGIDRLRDLGDCIFNSEDPASVFTEGKPVEILDEGPGKACLSIRIPYVEKADLDMWVKGDELTVKTPGYKRKITLPRILTSMNLDDAKFEEGKLKIYFVKKIDE